VSVQAARNQYGVVVDTKTWSVDEQKTKELRTTMREQRGWSKAPFIDRGRLPQGIRADS
jgi:hypothetical protein